MDCLELLSRIASWSFDGSRLIDVACIAFDSVSAEHVYELREQYRQQIVERVRVRPRLPLTIAFDHCG